MQTLCARWANRLSGKHRGGSRKEHCSLYLWSEMLTTRSEFPAGLRPWQLGVRKRLADAAGQFGGVLEVVPDLDAKPSHAKLAGAPIAINPRCLKFSSFDSSSHILRSHAPNSAGVENGKSSTAMIAVDFAARNVFRRKPS